MSKQETIRGTLLQEALSATEGERNKTYGDPTVQHKCMAELQSVYRRHTSRSDSEAHEAAMMMVLAKISRIAFGAFHRDNYLDGAAYLAIAYEAGETKRTQLKEHQLIVPREE